MPALFVFLFKVNIALLLFCAGYYLVLRHLTFYTLNRAYLMVAILFATLYPKIDLSDFAERHQTIKPVQNVVLIWEAPAETLINPFTHPDYWQWATVIFWAGAVFLGFRLLMQLFSLFVLYRRSRPARIHDHDVRVIEGEAAPFSFWQSIYVNPANHSDADLQAILLHEQVHVNGWHTIDILLAELSSVFYWFNPGIWLMKRAVRENIEFVTDRKIINKGFDSKTYQYSLVNVSFNTATPGIVNHFNISTIKKRIIMMNAKRSSRFKLTRYAFVVPAVVALLLVFTLSKAGITKPLSSRIASTIKPVTVALKQAAQTVLSLNDTVPAKKNKRVFVTKSDTLKNTHVVGFTTTIDSDTAKKHRFFIRSDNHTIDSMTVVLNGKKVDNLVFNKIDPSIIESINIIKSDDKNLKTLEGYKFENGKDVIFVATKDSPEGKALAEKLGTRRLITNIRINGVNKTPGSLNGKEMAIINDLPNLQATNNDVTIITHGNASTIPAVQLREVVLDSGIVRLNGDKMKGIAGVEYRLRSQPGTLTNLQTVTLDGNNKDVVVKGYRTNHDYTFSTGSGSVSRISDKLIVIDGKVATEKELKKLSAFDIDRMSTSNSADTVKKYGDKAKYGVVYIYTKKGK